MIYVSADLHGCPYRAFRFLLDKAGFGAGDYLFILGDVIDRGEGGVEMLKWLMYQPNVELILGNHEAMLLSCDFLFEEITDASVAALGAQKLQLLSTWQRNGGEATITSLAGESPEVRADILDYLRDCPLYDRVEVGGREFVLVHAGLGNYRADKPLDEYTPDELLWTRPDADTRYSDAFMTVHGHTPAGYLDPACAGRILKTPTYIDIDTGREPMLLCLDTMQEFYISDKH